MKEKVDSHRNNGFMIVISSPAAVIGIRVNGPMK